MTSTLPTNTNAQSTRSLAEWLAYIESHHPKSIAMGLDRCREVARRMGLAAAARRIVVVGGTNGKGSTVAFLEAIARAAGWRVGAYTSPHLLAYNERVRIDGRDASDADLVAGFEAVEAARTALGHEPIALTYFEFGTLAALWLFARSDLDLAVLEVGLGGRLDAVNIVEPDVAIVTTVDLDHRDWLGDTIEAIGAEKVGIARAWKPLILGDDDPPSSVLGHAYAIGASAVRIGCDFFFERIDDAGWRWREIGCAFDLPMPALAAPVQLRNAAVAIAALRALPDSDAWPEAIYSNGVAQARVAARLQRFERDGVEILVDVGHNPQAARALAAWLDAASSEAASSEAVRPNFAVFAALGDKDAAGVVEALGARIETWWLAGLADAGPRGGDVETFASRLQGTVAADGARFATVEEALDAAIREARRRAADGETRPPRVLVFGSFHTAAAALRVLHADASSVSI